MLFEEIMKKINLILFMFIGVTVVACGGGSSGSSNNNYSNVSPNPYPNHKQYVSLPDGFESAVPSFVQNQSNSLQIAWGYNNNPAAPNLAARILMNGDELCSATPVASDSNGGTWLIGAAHCFVNGKIANVLENNNLVSSNNIKVTKGFNATTLIAESAVVFIPSNYCSGSSFNGIGGCPNFSPTEGAKNGQGNDIALIHINTKFNESEIYPQIDNGSSYPQAYTMAPVLSLGYGDNNITGGNDKLFYVVNYFYQQSDDTGYHYLYNSYFNPAPANYGYSELVCGGDSGGGDLFWNGSSWILLSEHTYGPSDGCGKFYNYLPNGATNVSKYYAWLQSIMTGQITTSNCNSSNTCVTNG